MKNRPTFYASSGKSVVITVWTDDSSMISTLEWNNNAVAYGSGTDGELLVRFCNGSTYIYENVTLTVLWDVATAESVGKTYNERVKGKYEFRKLELSPVPA